MKRTISFFYGLVCYLAFFGTVLYAIGFVGNLLVPKSIDSKPEVSLLTAIIVNASLLLVFALQHSIMARPAFKRWWTSIIPEHLERSTYVLLASLCLMLLMWKWQPVSGIVWSTDNETVKSLLFVACVLGWLIVLASTFLINHFDLFGLRQVWLYLLGREYTHLPFKTPAFYRHVRHPLYLGWLFAFWATPTMTAAHLFFAAATTLYILAAIQFEEGDLVRLHGDEYRRYQKSVP